MKLVALAIGCALAFTSCTSIQSSLKPQKLPAQELQRPGFFDVGAGFGITYNTSAESTDDAKGVMVSLRGYPFGRWYSRKKAAGSLSALVEQLQTKRGELHQQVADGADDAAKTATQSQIDALIALSASASEEDLFILEERDRWWNRLSVFYGRSLENFDSGGIDGEVDTLGIGYDVIPQMAILAGVAFYDVELAGGVQESDTGFFLGVTLNLNAFRSVFSN